MQLNERKQFELRLFESKAGYEILDAVVQANLDLEKIPAEEFDRFVVQFSRELSPRNDSLRRMNAFRRRRFR